MEPTDLGRAISDEPPNSLPPRDAIHIACVPAFVRGTCIPGEAVAVIERTDGGDLIVGRSGDQGIGVIDPFIRDAAVYDGTPVWVLLNPGSVVSLRHHYECPAIDLDREPWKVTQTTGSVTRAEAGSWLQDFAREWGMSFKPMIDDAVSGYGITAHGPDIHDWSELPDSGEKFWTMLELYTGKRFDAAHRAGTPFSCSC